MDGTAHRLILLRIKKDRYYLEYKKGNNFKEIDITKNINGFCQGLKDMNIAEWNFQCFNEPWSRFLHFYWDLSITTDDVNIVCKGMDNFPENWSAFRKLLCQLGIADSKLPF